MNLSAPRVRGRYWRVMAPKWAFDPLSGAGAARMPRGRNIVLWRWNADPGATVRYHDPNSDLPAAPSITPIVASGLPID